MTTTFSPPSGFGAPEEEDSAASASTGFAIEEVFRHKNKKRS